MNICMHVYTNMCIHVLDYNVYIYTHFFIHVYIYILCIHIFTYALLDVLNVLILDQ